MSSQKVMLKFTDLKNLSSEEIVEAISSHAAVEVTMKSIEACEVSEQEIYKTWSTSLFKSFGPDGIAEADLNILLDSFTIVIKELLNECGDCENDEQIERLSEFLNYSLDLFTWIHSTASDFETHKISMFLCFGLSSIHNYLTVLSKQTSRTIAKKLIEKSLQIHSIILGVLAQHPKTFIFDDNESSLENLMLSLCAVGEIAPKLDIKAAVETWKCITRLASQNIIHGQSEKNPGDDVLWLSKPMAFLIKEVGKNVQTVYTQDSLNEPIQQIEKYLKVTNFYLRLLQKLVNDFRHVPFPICEEFISTLAVVFNPPVYIETNAQISKVIMDYIGKDLKELIPLAYRNDIFFEQLLSEHSANVNSFEAIHEIVLQTLEVIIRKNEPKYINKELLHSMFIYASDCFMNQSKTKYNRFVEVLSSLQVRFNDEELQKQLISTIFHDNTTQALTAIEILCTIFELSDQPTRLSSLKFWIDMNERFPTFSNGLPALHTELLLKNLYTSLSSQEKHDMWRSLNMQMLNHTRFLLTIGLEELPLSAAKAAIVKHFLTELLRFLKEDLTVDGYYTIVKDLKLLKPIDFQHDDLIEMLFQNLEIALENKKLYKLVEGILDFFSPKIGYIDGNKLQTILTTIKSNISLFDELSTRLSFIEFLKNVSKLSKFEKKSKELLKSLEAHEKRRMFGYLEEHDSRREVDKEKCDKLWKELVQNQSMSSSRKPSHTCRTQEKSELMQVRHNPHNQTEIEIILEALENNTNKLQKQTYGRRLSSSNLETIKRVVLKLKDISQVG
ncbi:uncharacterized protein LOC129951297 [Eupeodes corollae]|uniref:uncharacterized protein LOC129951297 n=1 Tax=Eupeodes corollae TaxID=290404 RepID=UPI002492DBC9|nr:uncharacterized protein LOC129951297 [Eupeodes corollae]